MPFQPGHTKAGGRKKGSTNKSNLAQAACEKLGVDPFAILAEFAKSSTDKRLRFDAAKELAQYMLPKLKATEISNGEGEGFRVIISRYGQEDKK